MNENKKVPKIRFPEFSGEWEEKSLEDIGEVFTGSTPSVKNENCYSDSGLVWITPTDIKDNISVESCRKLNFNGIKVARIVPKNSILVTCIASIGKNTILGVEGSFNQQINALVPNLKRYCSYFLYTNSYFWSKSILKLCGSVGMTMINKSQFLKIKTFIPTLQEQQKIGNFFKKLDESISLQKNKLDNLKLQKKSLLQKMFPKNGETIPEIRFPEFSGDWEEKKLGDLYKRNIEKNNGQFSIEKTISIATMYFKTEGNQAAEESLRGYKVLRVGDIAYEGHKNKEFSFGRFVLNDIGDGIMSPRFTTLRPINPLNINFWKQYIIYEPIMKHILAKSSKLGTMMNELVLEDFFKLTVFVPEHKEQQKIGNFFKKLDNLILLNQQKLENLEKRKKALLQKMFV